MDLRSDGQLNSIFLSDLLFDTNLSKEEIAAILGISPSEVSVTMKKLGLNWVKRKNKKMSRGQSSLTDIMRRLIPGEEVVNEYHIGERLMLDVYCPKYKLAIEYHGRQHFYFTEYFHKDKQGFLDSQKRDNRKEELCAEQGITLVVFRYNDDLNEDTVFRRLLLALEAMPQRVVTPKKSRFKGNPYYEAMKKRNREYQKAAYRRKKRGTF